MIGIVNYGLGNVKAFLNVYKQLGIDAMSCSTSHELDSCHHLIIPGVGSFDCAMSKLNASGMRDCLDKLVLNHKIPVLGICVGFQIMSHTSEEGRSSGLSWLDASVLHLASTSKSTPNLPFPHMGWNVIDFLPNTPLFLDLMHTHTRFYFLHSYFFQPMEPSLQLASSNYGINFCCSAGMENIFGVQFHPEKSHSNGVSLLRNFSLI